MAQVFVRMGRSLEKILQLVLWTASQNRSAAHIAPPEQFLPLLAKGWMNPSDNSRAPETEIFWRPDNMTKIFDARKVL
jgi:hypothetical protein